MLAASHSNYSAQPFMTIVVVVVVCPVLSAAPAIQGLIRLVYHPHVMCYCCLTPLSLCSPSQCCVDFATALFLSTAYVITDKICKFRLPRL